MSRLMRIGEAAKSIGVSTPALRTEIRNGRLMPTRIAGKIFLTAEQLQEMIAACRDKPRDHGSTSSATPAARASGSSGTAALKQAQAAARLTLEGLSKHLPAISSPSTSRRPVRAS